MKILHVLDHSLPLQSGYTFRSHNLIKAQKARGWELAVVTSPKHEQSWQGEWAARESIAGVTYYRTGAVAPSGFPFVSEKRLIDALTARIVAAALQEKPDLLHAHSPVLNAIAALRAGKRLGIPVVYEIRAFWEDAAVDHGSYAEGSWKYRLTKAVETWACRRVDHVAILCHGLKHDLVLRGIAAEKITPVFNGVDPEDFKPCSPDEEFRTLWGLEGKQVVGFIGSFYRYEGLDLLIRAFAPVAETDPDAMLLLVGGGEMEHELRALVSQLKLQGRVAMPGRIPHQRVPGVYALTDILAYPRYAMRLTELVTPLKPLEAMAMGKVLVASDVGGHRELIKNGENGVLFEAGKVGALEVALRRLLAEPDYRKKLAGEATRWVRERHSWQETTAAYRTVYGALKLPGLARAKPSSAAAAEHHA